MPDETETKNSDSIREVSSGEIFDLDDVVLQAQGHRAELERSFSWSGAVGLAYSMSNSWLGYAAIFGTGLAYGGGQVTVFSIIIGAAMQWIILLGLAELCSALPSSGGQYHYTYIMAPKSTKNFAAYTVGMMTILGWWVGSASGSTLTAISVMGIVEFWHPQYVHTQWQVYLCYVLVTVLSLIPVFVIPHRRISYLTKSTMYFSLIGFFLIILVLPIMGRGNYHPETITKYSGSSGWAPGPAWLLSISVGEYSFVSVGAITHITEEMPRPGRMVPRVINIAMLIGMITTIPWIIVMMCGVQDLDAVQKAFIPSLEVLYQATGSKVAATVLQAYLTWLYFTCLTNGWIICSRITWAFSRDSGLPLSKYWNHIHPRLNMPVRTTLLSAGFVLIYGLLYIASTTAFNCIVNTTVILLNISFTVPQGILLTVGRDKLPQRPFNLGSWGYAVNIFSVLWLIVSGVVFCFPTTLPTTVEGMNYGSVILVGIFVIIVLLWIERRGKFSGPVIDWERLNAGNACL